MNKFLSTAVAMIGVWAICVPAAHAADIIEQPSYVAPPAPAPVETSGWYLRGDIGYNFKSKTSGYYNFYNVGFGDDGIDNVEHYDEIALKNSANFGAGLGYRFNDMFRTDLTLNYVRTGASGSSRCGYLVEVGYGLDPVTNDCRYSDASHASIWTAMANAYVDLGTYGGITPYIGAGLGAAHVKYDDVSNEISCGGGLCGTQTAIFRATHPGLSSWRFASSLMAGASVDITQNLKFDAGYKYTRIAGGRATGYDSVDTAAGASGTQGTDNGFNIHTVTAGLRYEFGGGTGFGKGKEPAPVYADAPVYQDTPVYK
ncbi:porin family protein [Jiella sp. MQZ9-1]|uniref:Porin family protein n=1 Tax=Jiella flava TaxID=2816857 RepID=A0A939G061_9HYPH|nr:outer membrane protein [Jiella flava]MBO0664059.1 porin family protein [Jiella flava]MCD2472631.1 porin family protein [Jiella flava]